MIEPLLDVRGVRYAAVVNPQGQAVAQVGQETPDLGIATAARAMIGSLQSAMQANTWNDLLLDLDGGPVLLTPVEDHILITAFDDIASLGRVRFAVRRVLGKV